MKDTEDERKMRKKMLELDKTVFKLSDELLMYLVERACHEMDLRSDNRIKHSVERLERMWYGTN